MEGRRVLFKSIQGCDPYASTARSAVVVEVRESWLGNDVHGWGMKQKRLSQGRERQASKLASG